MQVKDESTQQQTSDRADSEWSAIKERIRAEQEYHAEFYAQQDVPLKVNFDLASSTKRRPHNLTWAYYDTILDRLGGDISGKRILVVGCGIGEVALNLAKNGAAVDAFDLCDKAVEICKTRAEHNNIDGATFFVSSCEELDVQAGAYDAVVGEMILHHIDIPIAMEKVNHALRPGGVGVFMEWKKYAVVDRVRSWWVFRWLFPPGGYSGYATEDERKLDSHDFEICRRRFSEMRLDYRYCLRGKLDYFFSPTVGSRIEKFDYFLIRTLPFIRHFTDGVIISFTRPAASTDPHSS